MKVIFQAFLYCCLVATAAHCVELEVNPKLKKRLSIWLGSRLRRDLSSESVNAEHFVRQDDSRESVLPHSSTETNVRTKRSKNSTNQSRRQGCSLGTCSVHDLAHRLQLYNNKLNTAPPVKISPHGYGRRRRSVPDRGVTLRLEHGTLRPVWRSTDSQVHKLEALLRQT
ncbi:adrenomedullin a isoform X2 [Corythoichthys intestinalis]|uniref:adrenomedullin a isoform X2 n=1 Tax=Corythoichthys intestinalis TaxID=161448 RepID=UPI0025A598DD|nr:adrenomedullin a isoform X2 [Corythoichthys intestinalis]XP_061796840.1 pro-adrenomedullin-like [Nerophis lumbriciformis]